MGKYKYLYLVASCSVLTLMMQVSVFGEVRNVYKSDGAMGIQDSINVSCAGDTVLVHNGIYYVRDIDSLGITMKDSVVLMSSGGAESCTLSGLNSTATDTAYHVIYCSFGDSSSHAAIIQDFTIMLSYEGSGIYCESSSPIIQNNIITNNDRKGIYFSISSSIVKYNTITNNQLWGIFCANSSPTIISNTITDNLSSGVWCDNLSSPLIQYNVITHNGSPTSLGGGIYYNGSPFIEHNIISYNRAEIGGGICCWHRQANATIKNNIIASNLATGLYGCGGGICCVCGCSSIENNVITNNSATYGGGGVASCSSFCTIKKSVIAGNLISRVSNVGGGIYSEYFSKIFIDSSFIVDNDLLAFNRNNADTLKLSSSHLYYNTFQPDIEIYNDTWITIPLENNFWWDTTETKIAGLIAGPADFTPWEYEFIDGVPGEPVSIDSVRNYDSDYSQVMDSLWDAPDTLYLRIYGEDRNAEFREAAVAIIKSSVYPTGIAVALIETDTSSGIYEGKAIVKTSTGNDTIRKDDIYQTVRVDSVCDSLQIVANMDTTQKFIVYYRICPGVEESAKCKVQSVKLFQNYPNPFTKKTEIRFQIPDVRCQASLKIYDLAGRLVKEFRVKGEEFRVVWDGKDKDGKMVGSGVYFYKLKAGDFTKTKKMFLIR